MLKRTLFMKILNYCDNRPKFLICNTKIYHECYCYGCMSGSLYCKNGHGLQYAN